MPLPATSAALAAAGAKNVYPALLGQLIALSGPVNLWTGRGTLTWAGITFQGAGQLLSFSGFDETSQIEARGITVEMSGFDPATLGLVLRELRHGQPITVWLALFTAAGELIVDPIKLWAGAVDTGAAETEGPTAKVTVGAESKLLLLNVPADRRYTNEDQQRDHPGDTGFSFVPQIQERTIYWGRTPCSTNNI